MLAEPLVKRATAFFDGQNLFHAAREAFGYSYPNFDPLALALAVSQQKGWNLTTVRFYTGVPDPRESPFWNHFWAAKLAQMGRDGIRPSSRPLRYRSEVKTLSDGSQQTVSIGYEKGIDVRLALDVVRGTLEGTLDVALIFSQDQDLAELSDEVRSIAQSHGRWIKIASAYPQSATSRNRRGIDRTDWIPIDRGAYDACLDPRDYRPRPGS
ncbi:MAG: NYN domain-containing protein [Acidobacteria bacterium]|nr:NYN domain-containing protein [Acidobacteriota bacterium]